MASQKIVIQQKFTAPVGEIFSFLSVHENLSELFGAKIKRIVDSSDEGNLNGVGSVRRVSVPFSPLEETVTQSQKDKLIEYKITSKGPLTNHLGRMEFSEKNGVTVLDYNIVFDSPIPLLAKVVKFGLEKGIRKGLKRFANKYE